MRDDPLMALLMADEGKRRTPATLDELRAELPKYAPRSFAPGDVLKLRTDIYNPYSVPVEGEPVIVLGFIEAPEFDRERTYINEYMLVMMKAQHRIGRYAVDPMFFELF